MNRPHLTNLFNTTSGYCVAVITPTRKIIKPFNKMFLLFWAITVCFTIFIISGKTLASDNLISSDNSTVAWLKKVSKRQGTVGLTHSLQQKLGSSLCSKWWEMHQVVLSHHIVCLAWQMNGHEYLHLWQILLGVGAWFKTTHNSACPSVNVFRGLKNLSFYHQTEDMGKTNRHAHDLGGIPSTSLTQVSLKRISLTWVNVNSDLSLKPFH